MRLGDTVEVENQPSTPADRQSTGFNVVSSSYFTTLGIPIVVGRTFTEADNPQSVPVAIVNRRFADVMWPNADAVGRRFRLSESSPDWLQVVGVTPTGRYHAIAESDMPFVYLPLSQHYQPFRFLHVRAMSSAETLLPSVVEAVRAIEPDIAPISVMTMEESLGGGFGLFLPRFIARFAALFAMLALFLAANGLYGLVSYAVGRRVREIGIRVALGATPTKVLRLVMREGLRLVVLGLAVGLIAALLGTRSLAGFLVGVSTHDPLTLAAVAAVLASVSLAACAIPALKAIRIEPVDALREE